MFLGGIILLPTWKKLVNIALKAPFLGKNSLKKAQIEKYARVKCVLNSPKKPMVGSKNNFSKKNNLATSHTSISLQKWPKRVFLVIGWVWFGENYKNEIAILKNLWLDISHLYITPKMDKNGQKWVFLVICLVWSDETLKNGIIILKNLAIDPLHAYVDKDSS